LLANGLLHGEPACYHVAMSAPWDPEISVAPELAQALIVEQFPQLAPAALELLGAGWDNTAYLVNCQFVFRFPRRQVGAECLNTEVRILPKLQSLLPLAIPYPTFIGNPTDRFPWLFGGYAILPGRTACAAALEAKQRAVAAEPLGAFLAALHSLEPAFVRELNAPPDLLGRLDLARRIPQMHERLVDCIRLGLVADPAPCRAIIETAATAQPVRPATTLVHGDLYVRHILVGSDMLPSGVIDWGDVHAGDIALDLSLAHTFLPPGAHEVFRRAYGPIDESTWRLARFRALSYGLVLSIYAARANDIDLHREGQFILNNITCKSTCC
jgi:aminoglycoside phosphotransferase (APT) family kinase protein